MTTKPVTFITGANKGIGNEVARQLAQHDFTVLIGTRNVQRGEAAAETLRAEGFDVHFVPIDINDESSIKDAAETVARQWKQVTVLINNAAVNYDFSPATRPSTLSVDVLKDTFLTNVFGAFATIHHFLPLLKQAGTAQILKPQIINISSTLGSLTSLSDPEHYYYGVNTVAYNSSKSALNAITVALAKDLVEDKISVNSICPGWVKTDMGTDNAPRTVEQGASIIVKLATMENPPTGKFLDDDGEILW
ncbi:MULTISPECIES: SDR family oxidoreductase [Chroococcidiopsis]|jgi:NAD(P)-dependent dehydrogenase (short-subunit alcohol dehydrogenase family)|uniref:Short-chain dehydrogenase/reductase SDR n=1 Tax=Chroococcidiopsis thermalis (strain PCC 7203) TaxID=251229 RepID=K9TTP1_CHRTP|nr:MULTISPECIES: SDR family oxidoreductase [Chroococcidiopsis]AFY85758.1 short-chain dehydrogenase/reductase SDR [Chroococcidiopsis thermalis PCC 7203]PSB47676.1 SDR family NAD(P)-dependent oxidoreductase [Cyanosarcina cf. burmensis CCALA 770]URD50603.1 SDR family oxidoreductase [Chroococcidiopsis sp. CCNUC1]